MKEAPIVSQWYRYLDREDQFQVTAVDEDEGLIEIQHVDGDFEELERESWDELDIEPTDAPEDWEAEEELDEEDYGESDEEEWFDEDEGDEGEAEDEDYK